MAIVQSDANGPTDFRIIHSLAGGVFRSEDGGEHWTRQNDIDPRPFYFSQIRIDPANDQRVYVLGMAMLASDDGGKNFREDLFEKVHPDCHALVIAPGSVPPPKSAQARVTRTTSRPSRRCPRGCCSARTAACIRALKAGATGTTSAASPAASITG